MSPSGLFQRPNPWMIGIELVALLVLFAMASAASSFLPPHEMPRWLKWLLATAKRPVLFVIFAALIARAALLPWFGVPEPRVNDEFGHLLAADTFSHYRLTNPTPVEWQHFETFHVNIRPTYHSMYPPAQGMLLALGQVLFHQPWFGVYLSTVLMCGAICWALQAFFSPAWALLGGLIAVLKFALFSYWMNSYWGGSVAAIGGALALGSVVRLCDAGRSNWSRAWLSAGFAFGLVVLANSRPYEGLAFCLPLFGYLVYKLIKLGANRQTAAMILPGLAVGLACLSVMGFYNHATTGNALLMPYSLNHRTYWPLAFFVGQKENTAARTTDPVFAKFFTTTAEQYEYEQARSLSGIAQVQPARVLQNWLFYVGPALTLPVGIGLISSFLKPDLRIVALVFMTTSLALAACIFNLEHYFAPATVAVFAFAIEGGRYMWDTKHCGERAFVIAVCLTVALTTFIRQSASATLYTQYALPDGRKTVMEQLGQQPGRYLVLVSYDLDRHYPGAELVHNGADFSSEKILWARSKGLQADSELCSVYPNRTFLKLRTDDTNVSFNTPYSCH